ncbi:MAG: carbohydrate kinase [Anaerolineae bacterium]|nr:carbohydrate kinase [Anaerolineae bacterium]
MTAHYIITIDVGTSSTKTALWDEAGHTLAEASVSYVLSRPSPLWAEIDANIWWQAVCQTTREVMAHSGVHPSEIAGIGVDGVGWTLVPVDQNAEPLAPAMIWLDRRAQAETDWLNTLPDAQRLIELDANPIDPAYITPKLLWLKYHQSEVFDSTYRFLTASGFITARLTGEFTCDFTQAYGYHFFDMAHERWDAVTANQIGVPLEKMPRLCACTEIIDGLSERAAQELGLRAGIPVIAGCLDAAVGALGAGVTRLGQTNDQGGQAGGFAVSVVQVIIEPQLIFSHHVLPNQYLLQAGTVGGGSLGWFRQILGDSEGISFESLSQQAAQSTAGSHGLLFLPYMAGERTPLWSSDPRGVFFGLSYKTSRADMIRALMEGCAFAVQDNVAIAEAKGAVITEYLGSGGAAQSAVWCQIKADIYGKPLIVAHRSDGGEGGHNLGLYALTAYAIGQVDDIGACVERLLPNRQVYEPSPQRHALYEDLFGLYRDLSRKLLPDFEHLAALNRKHNLE